MFIFVAWVLLGLVVGTIGTMVGAGGGFVLVPVLLLIEATMAPVTITATSLAVVAANAISGSIAYARGGRVVWPFAGWFALWSLPGVALGLWLLAQVDRKTFTPFFAVLLMALAAFAAIGAERSATEAGSELLLDKSSACKGALASLGTGTLAAFLGIGGGVVHVPLMVYWLRFPPHLATATSHLVLAVSAIGATAIHTLRGDLQGQWPRIIPVALGVIVGAQIGAGLSKSVGGPLIMRAITVALFLVALRLLFQ